jgi:hypothetical protein
MFQTKLAYKIKAHFMFNNIFFPENNGVYEMMWKKKCRFWQATEDNMGHAHCLLDT